MRNDLCGFRLPGTGFKEGLLSSRCMNIEVVVLAISKGPCGPPRYQPEANTAAETGPGEY